jgi:uncharacterized integral membrane protein
MVFVVIVLLGGVFAVLVIENFSAFATVARLSFFVWQTPPLPIGLWLLISCLFGACMLYVASAIAAIQERRELRMLRQRVADLEQAQVKRTSEPLQAFPPPVVPMPGIHGPLPPSNPQQ